MRIGEMRHRITFQRVTKILNENGFENELLDEYITVWAAVSNLSGREYFAAKAVQAENTVKFTIRYIPEIDQSMKILFRDKTYNITVLDNSKYRNEFIEIKAVEVDTDG